MVFNSIKKHNEASLSLYGIDLNEILTGFYNTLSNDDEFIRMFDPGLGNSRQDLYKEYEAKINSLLLGLINTDDECPMTAYNLITDYETDYDVFLNDWKNELFDMIYNKNK